MTYNPPLSGTGKVGGKEASGQKGLWKQVSDAGSSVSRVLWAMVRASQIGQMTRVLNSMPDNVLEEIGVKRSEIPDYARSLVDDGER